MRLNKLLEEKKYFYHGSKIEDLRILRPREQSHIIRKWCLLVVIGIFH